MQEQKIVLSTVADLIANLRELDPTKRVYLFSDAEGNDCNPLDYVGVDEDDNSVILVPMHRGWERYQ